MQQETQEELIDLYNEYLNKKIEQIDDDEDDVEMKDEDAEKQLELQKEAMFKMDMDDFDYVLSK